MLTYIWSFMILGGIAYGMCTGNTEAISAAVLESAQEAVELCITMAGVMGLWMGVMEIAQQSGLTGRMTRGIQPVISFLFPHIPKDHPVREYLSANMIANFLGLGWAATPAGLKAMEALEQLEEERRKKKQKSAVSKGMASNEMCTFLIINISSLQLIPVNIIAYRSQYGSADPTAIVGPGIAATMISTAAAVLFCKIMDRQKGGR